MPRSLRPTTIHPITTRTLQVLRVADVTPGMRRVTLGGPELKAHTAANGFPVDEIHCDGFDDHCKFILRHPDLPADAAAPAPTQNAGVLDWPHDELALNRSYTIRKWRPEAGEYGEMDVDFVKHGVGPATRWAYAVQPGEDIQIAGPKACATQPEGADWLLIAGDETALPAIGRWLEEMPADTRGQVFIEVDQDDHVQAIDHPDGVLITWLPRNGAEAGTTTALFDAVTSCEWWDGRVFAWVAGESMTLVPTRRWLRREKGLSKEQVDVSGYWRREAVLDEESGTTENTRAKFHELTEIFPGVAVRVAVTLGLGPVLAGVSRPLPELVEATGADVAGLAKLLRYLVALGLVELSDDGYSLTRLGSALDDEDTIREFTLNGVLARREAGLLSLLPAVKTGTGDYARWFGADFEELVQSTPELLTERTSIQSDGSSPVIAPLMQEAFFADLGTLRVTGKAAADVALGLVAKYPELHVSVLGTPAELEAASSLNPELGGHQRIVLEAGSPLNPPTTPVDATLINGGLSQFPDADAAHVISQAAATSGMVLVFGKVLNEDLAHEHDYEADLLDFTLYGGGSRTDAEHLDLFARAGVVEVRQSTVGWGLTLYRLG